MRLPQEIWDLIVDRLLEHVPNSILLILCKVDRQLNSVCAPRLLQFPMDFIESPRQLQLLHNRLDNDGDLYSIVRELYFRDFSKF
jgi:hypothetical protein